jgi:hypothetical protein
MLEKIPEQNEKRPCSKRVHLSVGLRIGSAFVELLQNGFVLECQVGVNIRSLLCEELGLSDHYVSERISTIFLDGNCVDNIGSAIVKEGSTLALSAAMPGLAGATLRRGGAYGSMRSSITHRENDPGRKEIGLCSIKLFNLLIPELGPVFLLRGILIKPANLENFLRKKPEEFWRQCHQLLFEGKPADRNSLLEFCRHCPEDFLLLTANGET